MSCVGRVEVLQRWFLSLFGGFLVAFYSTGGKSDLYVLYRSEAENVGAMVLAVVFCRWAFLLGTY